MKLTPFIQLRKQHSPLQKFARPNIHILHPLLKLDRPTKPPQGQEISMNKAFSKAADVQARVNAQSEKQTDKALGICKNSLLRLLTFSIRQSKPCVNGICKNTFI